MCGIAGMIKLDRGERADASRLRRMMDSLRHRGPDGKGMLVDGPVGLGHRRLAIVDVTGGRQPMGNEDGSVSVICNGEIYNHLDLRRELSAAGHRFATDSDTEAIVHAYEEYGMACVGRLQGMFAFAVWDGDRRRLLVARDRLGIKPLYYVQSEHELLFASEIKALFAAGGARPELDVDVLPEYLAHRFITGERTTFAGIRRLLPGSLLTWSPGQPPSISPYWSPPEPAGDEPGAPGMRAGELLAELQEAVRDHLMADVPLGLFLSGGLDSSGLAALAMPMLPERLRTYAAGFQGDASGELRHARSVAQQLGTRHQEVEISGEDFFAALPRLIRSEEEPMAFPASVPLHLVSRRAARDVKVVLTGEGADELFLGYNRYRIALWNDRLQRAGGWALPETARRALRKLSMAPGGRWRRALRHSFLASPSATPFLDAVAVFPDALQQQLFQDPDRPGRRSPHAELVRLHQKGGGSLLDRMSRADMQTYLAQLLTKQDRMSMAASIESRVPYLGDRLVERVLAVPSRHKLPGLTPKALLRDALREVVPAGVLRRPKLGFPVPLRPWLQGPFAGHLDRFLLGGRARRGLFRLSAVQQLVREHRAGAADHADRLWLLLVLEIWQRIFVEGDDIASMSRREAA